MTTTEQTTRERVMQAVNHGMELLLDLREAEVGLDVIRSQNSDAIKANNVDDLIPEMAADMETATEASEAVYQEAIKKLRVPLAKAEVTYETKRALAQEVRDKGIGEVQDGWDKKIKATAEERELAAVTAQAEVHRAKREAQAIKATIEQNAKVVKDSLGIDLNNLLS